ERIRNPREDQAWDRFVSLYTPFIFSLARRAGAGRDEAADLVQDVFLLLTKKMVDFKYDAQRSFRGWLRTVVMNRLHETARRKSPPAHVIASEFDLAETTGIDSIEETEYRSHLIARALEIMQNEFAPTTWKACW